MNKVGIVYWSASGNTQAMAECIAEGVKKAGGEAVLLAPAEFTRDCFAQYAVIAFGCPAMGAEVLEEGEFEPMFAGIENSLAGKKIALFGSYGWGDGQWMRDWCARCDNASANLFDAEGLMAHETPDDAAKAKCEDLGQSLAKW